MTLADSQFPPGIYPNGTPDLNMLVFPSLPMTMNTQGSLLFKLLALPLLVLQSCQDPAVKMGRGFRLPEGDAEKGKAAFIDLRCNECHTVAGVDLPKSETPPGFTVELGGEVRKVKSYGELVTAITQPQHIVAPEYLATLEKAKRDGVSSPMPDFNDRMTVSQLADIVTFLHAHYQKAPPPGMKYPYYAP